MASEVPSQEVEGLSVNDDITEERPSLSPTGSAGSGSSAPSKSLPPPPPGESTAESTEAAAAPLPSSSGTIRRSRPPVPTQSLLKSITSELPSHNAANASVLTPLRAHYLKKYLTNHQFMDELNIISDPSLGSDAVASLGSPFKTPLLPPGPDGKPRLKPLPDLPFLRFMFRQFVLSFPFLAGAPSNFWPEKVQPFLSTFLSLSLAPTAIPYSHTGEIDPDAERDYIQRRKIFDKLEKHMTLLLGNAIKLDGGEEVVRIGQDDLAKLEAEAKKRVGHILARDDGTFVINVIGVRTVSERGKVRSRSHEEFLVRTSRAGMPEVNVWRRYGDFKRLSEELRLMHPEEEIKSPPPKDRTTVTAPAPVAPQSTRAYLASFIPGHAPASPGPADNNSDTASVRSNESNSNSPLGPQFDPSLTRTGTSDSGFGAGQQSTFLSREKNRLTLRSWLRGLLLSPALSNSPVLRSFLLSGAVRLSPTEEADAKKREDVDKVREEGRQRFKIEAMKRVEDIKESVKAFREDLIRKGGLTRLFDVVRETARVEDLPIEYRKVLEWGRISLAAAIFQTFVAADTASETLVQLKRLHNLMPYFVLKGILKVSNPMAMIRGILDLFLARPFGGQSLIQRMFSTQLNEDVKELQEHIAVLSERIGEPTFCEKIKQFVAAPPEIQQIFKMDADSEGIDIIAIILRSPDAPALDRAQMQKVIRAHRAYSEYKKDKAELSDSDDDDGPQKDEGWLFLDLNVLMKMYARLQEKEKLLALIFEGATADLLKDIITIFYTPLATVYRAASIADSLGDLQNFINDLIRTVDAVEELSQEDPARTVQTFIDLVNRHEQAFYSFVHKVHSKGSSLFDSLMKWIELFLDFVRDGIPPGPDGPTRLDLDFILPAGGVERKAVLKEVDAVATYHYKLKVAHEGRTRRKFLKGGQDAEDQEQEQALVDGIVAGFSFGDTLGGDAQEIAEQESDEEDDEVEYEEFETPEGSESGSIRSKQSSSNAQTGVPKHVSRQVSSVGGSAVDESGKPTVIEKYDSAGERRRKRMKKVAIEPPVLVALPRLLPLYVEMVRPLLIVSRVDQPPVPSR